MNIKKFIFAAIGYILVTFVIAATWHLVLFKGVYDNLGIFTREHPIIFLGFLSMIIQGIVLAAVYPILYRMETFRSPFQNGLTFGFLTGILMASSAVFAEAGKNYVSSLPTWIILETIYYLLQFSITGVIIALIYGRNT